MILKSNFDQSPSTFGPSTFTQLDCPHSPIVKTSIITHERTRVGLSSYETKKLLSEIDSTIAKSKDQENQINIEKLKYYESDEFEKIIEPEYNYESCVEPR